MAEFRFKRVNCLEWLHLNLWYEVPSLTKKGKIGQVLCSVLNSWLIPLRISVRIASALQDELTSETPADCPLMRYLGVASERTFCCGGRGSGIGPRTLCCSHRLQNFQQDFGIYKPQNIQESSAIK